MRYSRLSETDGRPCGGGSRLRLSQPLLKAIVCPSDGSSLPTESQIVYQSPANHPIRDAIMEKRSQLFLQEYLNSLPSGEAKKYTSFSSGYFCADEENANACADLVLRGEKRATCSQYYLYSQNLEPMPQVGELFVVTRWDGEPVCITEITSVTRRKFSDVTPEFAAEEGEGDKTLESWKESHWDYFSNECQRLGIEPSEDMLLVLERFKVVYKQN